MGDQEAATPKTPRQLVQLENEEGPPPLAHPPRNSPRNKSRGRCPSCKNFTLDFGNYDPLLLIRRLYPIQQNDASPCRQLIDKKSKRSRQEIALRYSPRTKNSAQALSHSCCFEFYPKLTNAYFTLLTPGRPCSAEHRKTKKKKRMPPKLLYTIYLI